MNKVILMGRLVRDPEIRYSQGENSLAVARYTLAVDRRGRRNQNDGQPTADFIRCVSFGQRAEFAEKYMHQGMRMLVSGSIQTGSYQNKDGQTVYTTDIIVDEQEFADSKGQGGGSSSYSKESNSPFMGGSDSLSEGLMSIPDGVEDEGLPFT